MAASYKRLETDVEESRCCSYHERQAREPLRSIWRISTANLVLLIIQVGLLATYVVAAQWNGAGTTSSDIQATYGFDTNYMSIEFDYDWVWEEDAIKTAGTIVLDRDDNGNVEELGSISMFHALHCVTSLRRALQKAWEGKHVALNQNEDAHWPHCMHYLHQMIVCNADGLVERQHMWNHTIPFVSGAEDVRQCGNAQRLYDLYDEMKLR